METPARIEILSGPDPRGRYVYWLKWYDLGRHTERAQIFHAALPQAAAKKRTSKAPGATS